MTLKVEVYSDYLCPFCFLAEGPLNEAVAEMAGEVEVEWRPFELRPHPNPTLEPEGEYLQSTWQRSVYPMAEKMGVAIVLPKVSPQPYSRLAFEGSLFARDHGKADAYNHRMFTAFFQDELDIGDAEVLTELATELGLDAADFRAALDARTYEEACGALLRHAYETLRISSVPTFILAGRYAIPGMVPKDALVEAFREVIAKGT